MPLPESPFIYLASRSPRRQQLLEQIGVSFRLLAPGADEDAEALERVRPGEDPGKYVLRVTLAKAAAARERLARLALPAAPILVADTTVAIGGMILGKPAHATEALDMLTRLAGRTHRVITAVAVARGSTRTDSMVNVSRVTFARIPRAELEAYVATGEPMDKAGAYGIQGAIARHVRRIEGSYSAIMGLPLYETARLLGRAGRTAS
ncbi:MAG: septum formation inhibitor Maf [Pseudomonadota bacterium]|jgi:septum formation protein